MTRNRVALAAGLVALLLVAVVAGAVRLAGLLGTTGSIPASLAGEPEAHLIYPGSTVVSVAGEEAHCYQGHSDGGWVGASVQSSLTAGADADAIFRWYDAKLSALGWPSMGSALRADVNEYYRGAWPPEDAYTDGSTFVIYNDGRDGASGKTRYRILLVQGGQAAASRCARNH